MAKISFFSVKEDEEMLNKIWKHIKLLRIRSGHSFSESFDTNSDIVIILVSQDLIADRLDELQKKEGVRYIPILVSPSEYENIWLNAFQPLPRNGKPISKWVDKDDALAGISSELGRVIATLK
jgi:hypothetical protein